MKTKDVVKAIREYRGSIYVGMLVRDGVIYVKPVKSDLIKEIQGLSDGSIVAEEHHGALYVDSFFG